MASTYAIELRAVPNSGTSLAALGLPDQEGPYVPLTSRAALNPATVVQGLLLPFFPQGSTDWTLRYAGVSMPLEVSGKFYLAFCRYPQRSLSFAVGQMERSAAPECTQFLFLPDEQLGLGSLNIELNPALTEAELRDARGQLLAAEYWEVCSVTRDAAGGVTAVGPLATLRTSPTLVNTPTQQDIPRYLGSFASLTINPSCPSCLPKTPSENVAPPGQAVDLSTIVWTPKPSCPAPKVCLVGSPSTHCYRGNLSG